MTAAVTPRKKINYMPQLDGVRAICILMVFMCHWIPSRVTGPLGALGVYGFFVLSGFLITGILLGMREEAGGQSRPLWAKIKVFMMRRTLRIFPAYFVLVGILLVVDQDVRDGAVWYLTYTVNWLICWRGTWDGVMGHLWSLAMEEQFYLVWPWLLLLLPWRRIQWVFLTTLGAGIASRLILAMLAYRYPVDYVFPFSSLDFFAAGGMLAWLRINHDRGWRMLLKHGRWVALPLGILLVTGSLAQWHAMPWQVAKITMAAVVWAVVVACSAGGMGGVPGKWLSWAPLRWIGQISYGLYLLHPLTPKGIHWIWHHAGMGNWYEQNVWFRFAVSLVVTIAVAAASYYLFERPFLRLKKRWE